MGRCVYALLAVNRQDVDVARPAIGARYVFGVFPHSTPRPSNVLVV